MGTRTFTDSETTKTATTQSTSTQTTATETMTSTTETTTTTATNTTNTETTTTTSRTTLTLTITSETTVTLTTTTLSPTPTFELGPFENANHLMSAFNITKQILNLNCFPDNTFIEAFQSHRLRLISAGGDVALWDGGGAPGDFVFPVMLHIWLNEQEKG